MKITRLETFLVSVPYKHPEVSSLVNRNGVSDVLIKLTADNGLVGWGESCRAGDAAGVESAIKAMAPFVVGRDPWNTEAIARDVFITGGWQFQPMTGNFAFAGIDMALWDLCGQECGQPLYRLFGGAMRDDVDYFFYLHWADEDGMTAQCREGVKRGYSVFYLKVGEDEKGEEAMLAAVRDTIGPGRKIRIDANQSWSVPQAVRLLKEWHQRFDLDFVEAPVRIEPIECMLDVKQRVEPSLCANEGLWREVDASRIIRSHVADFLCFSPFWVGSLRRFHTMIHLAHLEGQLVCKHSHGELGIAAATGQHMMLAAPNACDGQQQTAQVMEDDVLEEEIPIATGPKWGLIERPGLGVRVSEDKVMRYREAYLRDGEFLTYGEPHGR